MRPITAYNKKLEEIRIRLKKINKLQRSSNAFELHLEKECLLDEEKRIKESIDMDGVNACEDLAEGYAALLRARQDVRRERNAVEADMNQLRLEQWVQSSSGKRHTALKRSSEPNEVDAELERSLEPNEVDAELERSSEPNEEGAELERLSEPNEGDAEANDGGAEAVQV